MTWYTSYVTIKRDKKFADLLREAYIYMPGKIAKIPQQKMELYLLIRGVTFL